MHWGGYVKEYNPFEKIREYFLAIVILIVYFLIWISNYNLYLIQISNYSGEGIFTQNIMQYSDNNLVCLVIGISIFELFRRINMHTSKIINFVGGTTFMVYLIHDNEFVHTLWRTQDWVTLLYNQPYMYIIKHVGWAVMTFVIGILMYVLYMFIVWLIPKGKCLIIRK